VLYTAPSFLGKGSKETFNLKAPERIKISKKLKMVKIERFQDDVKTTYYNRKA
jgi:riboflavin biosynthesis pyrimidine reductase